MREQLIEELKPLQDNYTGDAKLNEAVAVRDLIRALTPPVVSILPEHGLVVEVQLAGRRRVLFPRYGPGGRFRVGNRWVHERFCAGPNRRTCGRTTTWASRRCEGHYQKVVGSWPLDGWANGWAVGHPMAVTWATVRLAARTRAYWELPFMIPGKSQIVAATPNPQRLLHAAELVAGWLESSLLFPLAAKGI